MARIHKGGLSKQKEVCRQTSFVNSGQCVFYKEDFVKRQEEKRRDGDTSRDTMQNEKGER